MKALLYELYSDLFETSPVPLPEIERALGAFNLEAAMLRLSQINILLAQSRLEGSFDRLQNELCQIFFDDAITRRINERYAGKRRTAPTFFFRHLALYMMRVCARACSRSEEARRIDSPEDRHEFGRCCLWITDHVATEADNKAIGEGSDESRRKALGPQVALLVELGTPTPLKRAVARADVLFSEIVCEPKLVREMGRLDFLGVFKEATGLTIEQFRDLVFFIVGWFYGHDTRQMFEDSSKFVIHQSTYFSLTKFEQETVNRFLELTSVSIGRLPAHLGDLRGAANRDFTAVQARPLLKFENGALACLDLDYLVEKLSSGVYELVVEKFQGDNKEKAQAAWGYIFQEYVNRILNEMYPQTRSSLLVGTFTESPTYTTKEEAFDGILVSPTNPKHLFVFQYKSQFIRPKVKYGDDVEFFERALDHKGMFGAGKKGGVRQLVSNIELLWGADKSQRKQLKAPLSKLDGYEKITPVLVVQEPFFRGDFLNWTLNNRFQELLAAARISAGVTVEPLMVVDVESLEILRPYILSGMCTFSQAVNSLNTYDRDRRAAFRRHLSEYLAQFNRIEDVETDARFAKIMERVRRLFVDPD